MTRIVEQLLDMTRARLGKGLPMELRDVQLLPIVKAVIDELTLAYPKTRFELVGAIEVEGRWDPDRLGQVLSNLIGNAVQYGRKGAPVTIRLEQSSTIVTITVTNAIRDKPIPHDQLAVLFDPYRRGRGSEHRHTGLGLGLYIVHEIVASHGGRIDVESTDDGTSFHVMLPLRARALRPSTGS
jgi:signal transduction histidine kinase